MNPNLTAIPERIRELREILEFDMAYMAAKLNTDAATYGSYEAAGADIPISVLYEIAAALGVDATVLLTGDIPRMDTYSVTRKGEGVKIERFAGYNFLSLSYNFKDRSMDPLLVTLESDDTPHLVTHGGQEFNYVVEGRMRLIIGAKEIVLDEGDSVYFNPAIPHGQSSVGGHAVFLTVINERPV